MIVCLIEREKDVSCEGGDRSSGSFGGGSYKGCGSGDGSESGEEHLGDECREVGGDVSRDGADSIGLVPLE